MSLANASFYCLKTVKKDEHFIIWTRFILPEFKMFLLATEGLIKDEHIPILNTAFFNGIGLYLACDVTNYSVFASTLIKKHYFIFKEYHSCF